MVTMVTMVWHCLVGKWESNVRRHLGPRGKPGWILKDRVSSARLLPKSQPRGARFSFTASREIWTGTCQNRGSHPPSSAARTPAGTHSQSKAGRPSEGICCLFSSFCVCSASPPFPAPAEPWLRCFSTWVRGQLPSAISPHSPWCAPRHHPWGPSSNPSRVCFALLAPSHPSPPSASSSPPSPAGAVTPVHT